MTDNDELLPFMWAKAKPSIIMVAGIGGGGGNAVNYMYHQGIRDVTFMACNTDRQALDRLQIPNKIQLGNGLGAGNDPEKGRALAEENIEQIIETFQKHDTQMVFITAGMGGGTGTGASPVIARTAKEMGILTVAIVTLPFAFEGPVRLKQAQQGIDNMKECVDALLLINNENIVNLYGDLVISKAFGWADDILATAAKGIAEMISVDWYVAVDFADVKAVMKDSGVALMGSAQGNGENRADEVTREALNSPLLNHQKLSGAQKVLVSITYGDKEITMAETGRIANFIQQQTGNSANLIWGAGKDDSLVEDIKITVIATGYGNSLIEKIHPETFQENSHEEPTSFEDEELDHPKEKKQSWLDNMKKRLIAVFDDDYEN